MPPAAPQVVILAAGKGVRMVSDLPKVLHRVCGRTLLSRVIQPALPASPKGIVVVVGYQAELVEAALAGMQKAGEIPAGLPIRAVRQTEQKGTGHAMMSAEPLLGENPDDEILILPGDAPLLTEEDIAGFLTGHRSSGAKLSVMTAIVDDPAGFGRVIRNTAGGVERIVEKKDCRPEELGIREINASLYVASLGFLRDALKSLSPNNAQGEYYLTDIVGFAVKSGLPVNGVVVKDSRRVLGANDRAELSALEAIRRSEINLELMRRGVTLENPAATYVDEGVLVGKDSFLGAGTRLRGKTIVGARVQVDGDTIIQDSVIADDCHIKLACHIEGAKVGTGSFVGPFARLRQGAVLHENVHIGNFVEAKNTELHAGAKANHHSYLGDSSIGKASNIGAGTIFCNYDGEKKTKTEIGDQVFVGSNSTLVAPVTIESNSYVGAGSVITERVPEGSLALGRSRQVVKDGWMSTRKKK